MMSAEIPKLLARALDGKRPDARAALLLAECDDLDPLMQAAAVLRDRGHGRLVSYSRKVFIPLTKLCRNSCHYCTFAHPPRKGERAYLTPEEVLAIAEAGRNAGCQEALFTLGDKPELRYRVAREELAALGAKSTLDYLARMSALVLERTGLLPHVNPGVMSAEDIAALRLVSVSQGIMLETAAERLAERGGPHFGSPDKVPAVRLATIEEAGRQAVPFTSGILIGIGETRAERIEALLALRDLHDRYGHIQEIIIQNFRAKPATKMATAPEPSLERAPVDHRGGAHPVRAGDEHPGAAEPAGRIARQADRRRHQRLGRRVAGDAGSRQPGGAVARAGRAGEAHGGGRQAARAAAGRISIVCARCRRAGSHRSSPRRCWAPSTRSGWPAARPGWRVPPKARRRCVRPAWPRRRWAMICGASSIARRRAASLSEAEVVRLFAARGTEFEHVVTAADALRRATRGDAVTYVVNRNINYTNVCYFRCQFCAFSKGKMSENLRGRPYVLDLDEIERRTLEAWERGATEVCLQGGIHPEYTGATYLDICKRIKAAQPDMHVHAFSPLEVWQGAATLKQPLRHYLAELKSAGLSSLPGTAAEILDDEVRAVICPDKIKTAEWLSVMETAHAVGLKSTATIMFGHVDRPVHWARHLLRVRELQSRTGGFTEFVPLPFVPLETPIYLKGRARRGPTYREAVLMHAVARLALHPHITSIQTSWVKMGRDGAAHCLQAGANDIGGTLMNESITRAAGAEHGQEMPPEAMEALIRSLGPHAAPAHDLLWRAAGRAPAPVVRRAADRGASEHASARVHALSVASRSNG